jgi:hypothetical protein
MLPNVGILNLAGQNEKLALIGLTCLALSHDQEKGYFIFFGFCLG